MIDQGPTAVYRYFDQSGSLLYVGVTSRRTKRMNEHATSKTWWPLAATCLVEHHPNRSRAMAREAYLIWFHQPPFNTQGRNAVGIAYVAPPEGITENGTGHCVACGADGYLSKAHRMCRGCEGRRGRGRPSPLRGRTTDTKQEIAS